NGLESSVKSIVQPMLPFGFSLPSDNTLLTSGINKLGDLLIQASADILQPGALTTSVDSQVKALAKVEVVKTGLTMEIANLTKDFSASAADIKLYLGDGTEAKDFKETVLIP